MELKCLHPLAALSSLCTPGFSWKCKLRPRPEGEGSGWGWHSRWGMPEGLRMQTGEGAGEAGRSVPIVAVPPDASRCSFSSCQMPTGCWALALLQGHTLTQQARVGPQMLPFYPAFRGPSRGFPHQLLPLNVLFSRSAVSDSL